MVPDLEPARAGRWATRGNRIKFISNISNKVHLIKSFLRNRFDAII